MLAEISAVRIFEVDTENAFFSIIEA